LREARSLGGRRRVNWEFGCDTMLSLLLSCTLVE
jgi:hypothetical protein